MAQARKPLMRTRLFYLAALLIALTILTEAVPGRAQDGDAVIDHSAEVVYPAVIRFMVTLDLPFDTVQRVGLEVTQGGTVLRSGALNIEQTLFSSSPFTQFLYAWPLNPNSPPALLEPISYRWEIGSAGGVTTTAEGEVIFTPSPDWRIGGEGVLRFAVAEPTLNVVAARQAVLPAYELMQTQTGESPEFNWAILPRGFQFCQVVQGEEGEESVVASLNGTTYPCTEEDGVDLLTAEGYQVLYRQGSGLLPFQNELVNAMFDEFYGAAWRGVNVPDWFRVGLRQYYHVTPDPLALRQVQTAARADRLLAAEEMARIPDDPEAETYWAQQAATLVLYLADRYGAEAPFDLAQQARRSGFDAALRRLTDTDLAEMMVDWARWLFEPGAETAAVWTVYQPTTPTPTPSRTATDLPPTATRRPTASATPLPTDTPTATSRVIQVASPLPTFTPVTAVPTMPTNTPRPAGSLDQPAGGGGGGNGICPASLPALLLPFAAVVLVRRKHE
jgi:hypothetical protein